MLPVTFRYRRYLGWRKHWLYGLLLAAFIFAIVYLLHGGGYRDRLANQRDWPTVQAALSATPWELPDNDQLVLSGPGSRHYPATLNASKSGVAELLQNPMKLDELRSNVRKTLSYLSHLAKPSEFDANAGSCMCGRIAEPCNCCARLTADRLRLGQTACVQFAYLVHRQAMRTRLLLAGSILVDKLLSAASMPSALCAGEHQPRLELCARFRNASYTVQIHSRHKTRLSGCIELLVNLANTTIYAYPLGCFNAEGPSDSAAESAAESGRSANAKVGRPKHAAAGHNLHMDNWVP
ncbi:hypothetical protein BOX15_Mlig015368g1 [Macrostomum lignano]|uniref:DUF4773 domain-containing protein n=1 Tax=Macrostomum lignano TaxID=282301 RepID=A0A267EFH9_9PLAT|nr:hypothetical protein BOX15_Mlig015368g1 [Macrostomum lignano]